MAKTYDKFSSPVPSGYDRTLILDTREALIYPFPYEDWTSVTLGIEYSNTTNDDDNALPVNGPYTMSSADTKDKYYFGLKGNNDLFPGQNQEPFMGVFPASGNARFQAFPTITDHKRVLYGTTLSVYSAAGVMHNNFTPEVQDLTNSFNTPGNQDAPFPDSYAAFHGLRFTITNKGLSNQNVTIQHAYVDPTTKLTDAALRNLMLSSTYNTVGTFPWNNAGAPYKIPDAIFIYSPFSQIRVRLHTIGLIKHE